MKPSFRILNQSELVHPASSVAPMLLGKLLLRRAAVGWMGGYISEAEAYEGEEDQGCHARVGRTPRTAVMYGPPGIAYIYFTYGMHWMLNVVTGAVEHPAAVLIRAIHPVVGTDLMVVNRPHGKGWKSDQPARGWTDGPAKLCQALALNGELNGTTLISLNGDILLIDVGARIPASVIEQSARIGLFTVPEPWKSIPWNWHVNREFDYPELDQVGLRNYLSGF